jgi:hypothetical protein
MSQVKDPSMSIVIAEETDPRTENRGTWVINVKPSPGWVDPLAIFHGFDSSFGFADGHSENHRWTDEDLINSALLSANGIVDMTKGFYFKGGNAKNPDFRWVYERYKHKKWAPL